MNLLEESKLIEATITHENFIKMLSSDFSADKISIITQILKNKMFINKSKLYFCIPKYKLYKEYININKDDVGRNEMILHCISKLLRNSFEKFTEQQKQSIKLTFKNPMKRNKSDGIVLFDRDFFINSTTEIIMNLTDDTVNFNAPNKYEMHFRNGYWDLKKGTFQERTESHKISIYIRRDYSNPSDLITDMIHADLKKIIPNEDDKNYLLFEQGKALTGEAMNDQTNLFLLGAGSNGKSVIMKMLKFAIDIYLLELKSDTFTEGNNKIDKILNEFLEKAYYRIAWINEMEDRRIAQALFKSFCEGLLQTTSLYKDGLNNFKHFCKLFFTSNNMPRLVMDGGTIRRIDAYEFQSLFVDEESKVNEAKNIYLKNKDLLNNFENNDEYKNAYFKIIAGYCKEWCEDKNKYKQTENFKETKGSIVDLNDVVQNFIDDNLITTDNEKDRLGRKELYENFKIAQPKSFITESQFFSSLKQKGIEWSSKFRCKTETKQGCFYCVKYKTDDDTSPLDNGIEYAFGRTEQKEEINKLQSKVKEQEEEIARLKKMIEEMNNKPSRKENEEVADINKLSFESIDELEQHTKKIHKQKNNKSALDYGTEGTILSECKNEEIECVSNDDLSLSSDDVESEDEKPKKKIRRTKKISKSNKPKEHKICKTETFDNLDDFDIDNF